MKPSIILIANPVAKRASVKKIKRATEILRSSGCEVDIFLTSKKGDAEDFARKISGEGGSTIIAAGGDGTINEVINGIAHTETALAVLPMGTTNVLAKELGIPENVEGAINAFLKGKAHSASLGKIAFSRHASRVTRYFSLMAGIGFDGEAVYNFRQSLKKFSGKGAYIVGGLKTLLKYSPEPLSFVVNGEIYTGYSAIIGNVSKYGGNFKVTPDASILNPELYAFIMQGRKRSDFLRYFGGILRGRHLEFKDIKYLKAASVEIKGNARIQIDGDYLGETPASVTVENDAVKLIF